MSQAKQPENRVDAEHEQHERQKEFQFRAHAPQRRFGGQRGDYQREKADLRGEGVEIKIAGDKQHDQHEQRG